MTDKIIYLLLSNERFCFNAEDEYEYEWSNDPAPTIDHDSDKAIRYIRDDGEITELLGIIKDCLSYADAQAVLRGGEAVELRDKCRAVINKYSPAVPSKK
jgi:hypothetical protein